MSADNVSTDGDLCSIASTLEVIGDRWTLLVLRDAFRGLRRFDQLQADLGVARNILADRLARLVEHGVLEKIRYQDRPPRYEYRLTQKGVDLSPALVAMMRWGDKHLVPDEVPPVVLIHDRCGTTVEQSFHCPTCNCDVSPGQLRSRHPRTDPGTERRVEPCIQPSNELREEIA